MHISFYPPLGAHTRVPVGAHNSNINSNEDAVRAACTAHLSPQDYAEVAKTGLRIEVWTNAPSGTRPAWEWGPVAFQEVEETTAKTGAETTVPDLILGSEGRPEYPSPTEAQTSKPHVFRAEFTLPRSPASVFAYTYRLVYPSGICWLGSDRDNGVLELDGGSAFFEEIGSWRAVGETNVHVDGLEPESTEDCSVVGKLDINEWTWAGWATDGSRVWSFGDTCLEPVGDAVLAYLIPSAFDSSVLLPRSYVFHVHNKEMRFSINSQGHITIPNKQKSAMAYREHDPSSKTDLELLRSQVESLCYAPHILFTQDMDSFLFTPNYDSEVSVTIYAQNLARSSSPSRSISLPIRALDPFANSTGIISIFEPETRKGYFVSRTDESRDLKLRFGSRGAEIVISAVYGIAGNSASPSGWQFSIPECPAAPERVDLPSNAENPLPTPPASPPSKPQRSVTFVLPIENDTEGSLRQRKPVEPSDPTPGNGTVAKRILRNNNSAFESYQAGASPREKFSVFVANLLKLLARFMGIAVIRFILFTLRLLFGKMKELQSSFTRSKDNTGEEDRQPTSILPLGSSEPGAQTSGATATGSNDASGASSVVGEDIVETPTLHIGSANSTEAGEGGPDYQAYSNLLTSTSKSAAHGLKWALPVGDEVPIRLLVHSDAKPEELLEQLEIELNGGEVKQISSVYGVGEKTSIVEILRLERVAAEFLVRLRS